MDAFAQDPGIVIIGGGPAGLTAAYELARQGTQSTILEKDGVVGGLSRTEEHSGYLFDIGGHRFYTKVALVEAIWRDVLGEDLLTRPRLSRVYYHGRFYKYPLSAFEALRKLGPIEAARCSASYAVAKLSPHHPEDDLESWLCNRFGRRLYEIFFKTYTEKVWGMPCREIRSDWASQRIKGLSLASLLINALTPRLPGARNAEIKTLIQRFLYPKRGPGQMWTRMKERVEAQGCRVVLNAPVERIGWSHGQIDFVATPGGRFETSHLISSMPVRDLLAALDPAPPEWLAPARHAFRYRDFLTVALFIRTEQLFDDNWIYVHEPAVKVGRIQNFKNWSPEMVPDGKTSCLGMEYFCQETEPIWAMKDEDLIQLAKKEIGKLGLADPAKVVGGAVVRAPKAYPVYDDKYQEGLELVRAFLAEVPNLQLIGRNGMHRYNNQDHSMLTGILAARNILGAKYDLWAANVDEDYLEEGQVVTEAELDALNASQPSVPTRVFP